MWILWVFVGTLTVLKDAFQLLIAVFFLNDLPITLCIRFFKFIKGGEEIEALTMRMERFIWVFATFELLIADAVYFMLLIVLVLILLRIMLVSLLVELIKIDLFTRICPVRKHTCWSLSLFFKPDFFIIWLLKLCQYFFLFYPLRYKTNSIFDDFRQ